jgi:hypothetical protein
MKAQFGIPRQWDEFAENHRLFLERFPNLQAALNMAFIRKITSAEQVDVVVFLGGRLCELRISWRYFCFAGTAMESAQ